MSDELTPEEQLVEATSRARAEWQETLDAYQRMLLARSTPSRRSGLVSGHPILTAFATGAVVLAVGVLGIIVAAPLTEGLAPLIGMLLGGISGCVVALAAIVVGNVVYAVLDER